MAISLSEHFLLATNFDGIVCSDTADNAPDITDALNKLFTSICAYTDSNYSNQKVYFPKGFYRITGPVNIYRSYITADLNATFLLDGPNACFKVVPYGEYTFSYEVFIDGITLSGINNADKGLIISDGSQFVLRDISIFHFKTALSLNNCDIGHISRPTIQYCDVGVLFNYTTAVSIHGANFFANYADTQFLNYNSGVNFIGGCYFENSNYNFLFDSTSNFTDCTNINVLNSTFSTGQSNSVINSTDTAILKVIGQTNSANLQGFNFTNNRSFFNHPLSKYAFSITTLDVVPHVSLFIANNTFYNVLYPTEKLIYTNAPDDYATAIVYQDNINTNDSRDIIEGKAYLTGLDHSGTQFTSANYLRGPLVLDGQPNIDISALPGAIYFNKSTNMMQYVGTDGNIYNIPHAATQVKPSAAKTLTQLRADLNTLINKLIEAGVINKQ